jgi:hypothetical protein
METYLRMSELGPLSEVEPPDPDFRFSFSSGHWWERLRQPTGSLNSNTETTIGATCWRVIVVFLPCSFSVSVTGMRRSLVPIWRMLPNFSKSGCSARSRARIQTYQRHCEEQSDETIHSFFVRRDGLLRFARNDG